MHKYLTEKRYSLCSGQCPWVLGLYFGHDTSISDHRFYNGRGAGIEIYIY